LLRCSPGWIFSAGFFLAFLTDFWEIFFSVAVSPPVSAITRPEKTAIRVMHPITIQRILVS
jgi:hypothetical protein